MTRRIDPENLRRWLERAGIEVVNHHMDAHEQAAHQAEHPSATGTFANDIKERDQEGRYAQRRNPDDE